MPTFSELHSVRLGEMERKPRSTAYLELAFRKMPASSKHTNSVVYRIPDCKMSSNGNLSYLAYHARHDLTSFIDII